jgi:hypothetical protein
MIKYSLNPGNINDLYIIKRSLDVSQLLSNLNKKVNERFSVFGNPIIIVDFGTWLRQLSYADQTGWFVQYRIAPLDKNLTTTKMLEDLFKQKFPTLFNPLGNPEILVEGEGDSKNTTIIISDGTNSIGD